MFTAALTLCLIHPLAATTWCTTATPTSSGRPRQWEITSPSECTQMVVTRDDRARFLTTILCLYKPAFGQIRDRVLLTEQTELSGISWSDSITLSLKCLLLCVTVLLCVCCQNDYGFNGAVIHPLGFSNRTVRKKENMGRTRTLFLHEQTHKPEDKMLHLFIQKSSQ